MKRHLIPYRSYRWFADQIISRILVYGYKRELERGDTHEARHIAMSVQTGNSQDCDPTKCRLDRVPFDGIQAKGSLS